MARPRPRALLAGALFVLHPLAALADGAAVLRGASAFKKNCAQCHGDAARGDGPLAARFDPSPSNLVMSMRSDEYKTQIITLGGAALGRSAIMPEWGLELSGQEILSLVEYLGSISASKSNWVSRPAEKGRAVSRGALPSE